MDIGGNHTIYSVGTFQATVQWNNHGTAKIFNFCSEVHLYLKAWSGLTLVVIFSESGLMSMGTQVVPALQLWLCIIVEG